MMRCGKQNVLLPQQVSFEVGNTQIEMKAFKRMYDYQLFKGEKGIEIAQFSFEILSLIHFKYSVEERQKIF